MPVAEVPSIVSGGVKMYQNWRFKNVTEPLLQMEVAGAQN